MRPVNKGNPPQVYTDYGQARHHLAETIGYYCSYCEMKVYNSIEVEHILPQNQGGAPLDWDNFLLSCKYCNTIKGDHNHNLQDYVWPDRDNTDIVFDYSEHNVIEPKAILNLPLSSMATSSINLMGLNRIPGSINQPTFADTRWRSREETWTLAKNSFNNWIDAPILAMARQIAIAALQGGHYSIWCEVFSGVQLVLDEIDNQYLTKNLFKEFSHTGQRVIRLDGHI